MRPNWKVTYLWQMGGFFLCSPACPKQPRTSFPFYKLFYTTISARISGETTTSFPMSLNPKCTSRSVISTSAYISWNKNIQHFNLMSPLHIRFLFFSARRKRRKYLLLKLKQIPTYCFSSKLWNSLTFIYRDKKVFSNFSCRFLNPNNFF